MRKILVRWVPCLLTIDYKFYCATTAKKCLVLFNRYPDEYLHSFINLGVTRIHHKISDTNQLKQWGFPGELVPKNTDTNLLPNKIIGTVFWEASIIHIDYFQKWRKITGEYFANL